MVADEQIERLEFDQLEPGLQDVLRARVERLGYLGEFFKCAGHQPEVLAPFMVMTEALKRSLCDNLTEVGALTVARVMGSDYELHQHERLSSKLGFSREWIADVERLRPMEASELSDEEVAVQCLVLAVIERKGKAVEPEFRAVMGRIGPQAAIAILFLVGRYVTHSLIVNTLGLAPPVPSIFAEDRP